MNYNQIFLILCVLFLLLACYAFVSFVISAYKAKKYEDVIFYKKAEKMLIVTFFSIILGGIYYIVLNPGILQWIYLQLPVLRIIIFAGAILLLVIGWYRLHQSKADEDAGTRKTAITLFLIAFILAVMGLISCFL